MSQPPPADRRRRRGHHVALAVAIAAALLAQGSLRGGAQQSVTATPVTYRVTLAQDALLSGHQYTVRGFHYTGASQARTVVLLLHGLSYGYWAWDFPIASDGVTPYAYSTARYLASNGYDAVAIDELGYGSSDHPSFPDARQLTIPAYANMAHQIIQRLRTSYARVIIAGHSAGGEMANFEAGRYRDVDGLVDMSMCDVGASAEVIEDIAISDSVAATQAYGYFGLTPAERTRLMYYLPDADPTIVARDTAMANRTPTAEMQSISPQPARELDPLVNAPVLVAFGPHDAIFPPDCQLFQPLLYRSARSVTTFHLPVAGHSMMLHRNAAALEGALLGWLHRVAQ